MTRTGPVRPGQVLRIPEAHYRFGAGDLVLRVQAVLGTRELDDGPWLVVSGVEVYEAGYDGPERAEVLVRLSFLHRFVGAPHHTDEPAESGDARPCSDPPGA